jgi:hypothetical protein
MTRETVEVFFVILNNKKHGFGVYYYFDGDKYEGNFLDDKMHGKGIFYYYNSDKFEGNWLDDKFVD